MNPIFFSRVNDDAAISIVDEIMAKASTCLQIEMCYVTGYGVQLLSKHQERVLRPGSFVIASDDPTNDLEGLNRLAEIRPESVRFHSGSDNTGEKNSTNLMHAKIIYAEDGDHAKLWVGSHNFTMRGLAGINIEAAMLYQGNRDEQIFEDARKHLAATAIESSPGPIEIRKKILRTSKSLIIECEADEASLSVMRQEKSDFCISLGHEMFDMDCIPPDTVARDVRLLVYPSGSLTHEGPQSAPLFIKSGQVTGVTFTEHNTKAGSGARWDKKPGYVRMSMRQHDTEKIASPLHATLGEATIEKPRTISAFYVDSTPFQVELHLDGPIKAELEYDVHTHKVVVPDIFKPTRQDSWDDPKQESNPREIVITTRSNGRNIQIVPYHGSLNNWHVRQLEAYARKHQIALRFEKISPSYKYIRRGNLLTTGQKYFVGD